MSSFYQTLVPTDQNFSTGGLESFPLDQFARVRSARVEIDRSRSVDRSRLQIKTREIGERATIVTVDTTMEQMMAERRFEGQVVLITGAGTGIGKVLARAYAREGAKVTIAARRVEPLEETVREVGSMGGECWMLPSDVTREAECCDLVARTLKRFGRLDVLLNNAAIPGTDMRVAEMTLDNWNQTIATDLTGPMLLSREALRQAMIPARRGNIQFFSSAAAKQVRLRRAHYAVAKMGLIPLTQTLALEVSELGIRVNCLVIGMVAGELVDRWIERTALESGRPVEEVRTGLVANIPMRRPVEPEEVAALSLYLASDAASAITGQSINVTNGSEMR